MDTALLLSLPQFAFSISLCIICPSFTIGLAAWLTVLKTLRRQNSGRPASVPFLERPLRSRLR